MSEVRVITVSALHGAGGEEVGALVAKQMGWNLLDRALLEQISAKLDVAPDVLERYDQHVDPWFRRMVKSLFRSGFESASAGVGEALLDCEAMVDLTRRAVLEAAKIGECVIVGRGGQCILGPRPEYFHVFMYAPLDTRMGRLARKSEDPLNVESEIKRTDKERLGYIRRFFDEDWFEPSLYDLMINAVGSDQQTADLIVHAVRARAGRQ
jgi:cytidylate kinase